MAGRADVARLAGVSPAVVSYVTNGSHAVGAETRARVLAAIAELGYRPNALARSLATSRSHTLGLLLPDSSNPYFAELSSAIEDAAFAAGFTVLLGNGDDVVEREMTYVRTFLDRQVDGVIVCPSNDFSHGFDELVAAAVPVVSTDRVSRESALPAVVVDNEVGARTATEHLIGHGRTTFACISGHGDMSPAQARAAGWEQALRDADIDVDRDLLAFVDFSAEGGWEATRELLRREPRIDALFVGSDLQAVGALRAIADSGRTAGKDVSVVGFDGIRLGEYISPRLTTVAQPFRDLSKTVVELMVELIDNPDQVDTEPRILPTRLEIRESCGCLPLAAT
ncbi:LacI family DNA-binding transcriptional regulator [Microbacterium sp. ASV49]|uniref:LacI family DNA-binding transcriptional regulator n=1 Tax=Microbacterium candidum TaxID=3041922 RepID=A0ABT7MVE4_9MICO|nr:LacI family DNA-binding transcriptional regulator [Microbacterium sp. ASV49]MDL9978424.1 LacI family DNA-binding transcriptional regulator [Microbacterium sp. ASV49]